MDDHRHTLLIVKHAVERGLLGEILTRLEHKGLRPVVGRLGLVAREVAERHYAEHRGKAFYDDLIGFICRSPAFVAVLEGPPDAWAVLRTLMGATDPRQAAPGTIRGDLATEVTENLVHGSDSAESAAREISLFFPDFEPAAK
jgi:nucleoside-diphosphate kinase